MPYYKGSWYSQLPAFGWFDPEDRPGSAAFQVGGRSIPDSQQGIALPSRKGLGKWFNVTPPGGNLPFPMQQTDVGPAPYTGRGVDISAAAAHQMGYTPRNFPTDAPWKVEPRDEPRGLGSPAGMPVQAGDIPDNADDTAIAPGPTYTGRREPQGPKMPTSLMDMFQPTDAGGAPVDIGKALASRSNSLIGLGMGLMGASRPGLGEALHGYQVGSSQDAQQARYAQAMAHQKTQDARQAAQDAFQRSQAGQAQSNWERQFARSGEQPTIVWQEDENGNKVPYRQDPRSGTISRLPVEGTTTAAASETAPPDTAIPPAPPGSDRKKWREEQTKLRVQQQTAAEAAKRAGASIDPVTEDIDRSIAQISKYPGMTTGGFSSVLKKIPIVGSATQAGEVESLINTVKASSSLEKLQQMRAQSPTGASGLGAVTQGEHALLQNAIGSLDQSQDSASVLYNLERIKRIRHEIIHGPGTAPPPQFAPPSYQQSQRAPAAAAAPKAGTVSKGYVFKGGDPSDEANWAPVKR